MCYTFLRKLTRRKVVQFMLKGIIAIFVVFSASYWIGYFVKSLEIDYRPVCYVAFLEKKGDLSSINQFASYYGLYEEPVHNFNEDVIVLETGKGVKLYFLLSKKNLVQEANGRDIMAVVNIARYSRRNDSKYILRNFYKGTQMILKDDTFEIIE